MAMRWLSLKFSTLVGLLLLLFAAGLVAQNTEIFGLWTTMPSLPQDGGSGLTYHTATLLGDGNILIAGGASGATYPSATASAALYLPNSNQWISVPSMFLPRGNHGASLLPGGTSVLVAGGTSSGYPVPHPVADLGCPGCPPPPCGLAPFDPGTTETEVFDETSSTWIHALSMNSPRTLFSLVPLTDGRILAAAGSSVDQSAEVYTPSGPNGNTWASTGNMNAQRTQAAYTILPDGRVFVAGGDFGYNVLGLGINCPADAEVYDPSTNNWSNAGNMAFNHYAASATVVHVADGSWRVLVAGGYDGNNNSAELNSAELWNPNTNTFSPAASMASYRHAHTATLLPNGQVLVAGGISFNSVTFQQQALSFAEIYDPVADSWQPILSMNVARAYHTATLELGPGPTKLLIVGGIGGAPQGDNTLPWLTSGFLPSAEIFQPTPIATTTSLFPSQPLPGNNTVSSCGGGLESFVVSSTGIGAPAGFVSFFDSAIGNNIGSPVPLSPVALSNSEAILNAPLSVGTHSIQALYGGTDAFSSSSSSFQTIQAISPPIQVNGPATAFLGQPVTLFASVPADSNSPYNFTWTPPNGTAQTLCSIVAPGCFAGIPPSVGPNVFTVTGTDSTACQLATGTFTVNVLAVHFAVSAPASVTTGVPFTYTVTAVDNNNNVVPSYAGTAHFTSSDSQATLPSNYSFAAADRGVHNFPATLVTGGNQTITATDILNASITGTSGPILVMGPDFSVTAPSPINVTVGGTENDNVTVASLNGFNSPVTLSTPGLPSGVTTSFSSNPVTPPSGGSVISTVSVTIGPGVTPMIVPLTITGTSGALTHSTVVNFIVAPTPPGIASAISSMQAASCIDSSGISGALTSKLTAAQSSISAGDMQSAINTLTALKNQIQAQTGKHIATSCSAGGMAFNPSNTLLIDAQSLINSLRTSDIADPITGYVVNSANVGVPGTAVSMVDSNGNILATATTDITGFYYFPTTGVLTVGSNYTIVVTGLPAGFTTSTPASQAFAWQGTGLAFNFALN